jgi:hypothetical protein
MSTNQASMESMGAVNLLGFAIKESMDAIDA